MKILLKDIKSARWAIILIIAYFVLFRRVIYTICPAVLLTGFPCPGCGLTRATLKILRLDFCGAWKMHPFIYPIGILVVFFCVNRYLMQEKYLKTLKILIALTGIAMIIFYVWRMMMMFPDIPPMTYYNSNYLKKILNMIKKL